ncbi:hypothetical protein K443DRAFT_672304 [Laccaria amethystina LaAM-08-1]|uniref:Uncharacterized protein n=1 Tax=Laccaria amethystina LaAM-08-1 TaxID=1095629 RepID=A0A0C9XUT8_9AGAR|nr:hypothetical protein K443DRAFT_672304 [Laccaria amethystina LaAM-08-1]
MWLFLKAVYLTYLLRSKRPLAATRTIEVSVRHRKASFAPAIATLSARSDALATIQT